MISHPDRIKERSQLVRDLVCEYFPEAVFTALLMGSDRVFLPVQEPPRKYIDKAAVPFYVVLPIKADWHAEGNLEIPLEILTDDTDEALRECVTKQLDEFKAAHDDHVKEPLG